MIRTRKLILALLAAIVCAAVTGSVILFGANDLYARAVEDTTHADTVHVTALGVDTQIEDGGHYYLDSDVNRNIEISEGATVELCLNGYTLTGTGTGTVITVNNDAQLTLHDCSEENVGKITGGSGTEGGAIYIAAKGEGNLSGTVIMNGGTIEGNTVTQAESGVAVYSVGTFTMNDGKIVGNGSDIGIYIRGGVTTINGGLITGCDTGVHAPNGTFTMTGGQITGNTTGVQDDMTFKVSGAPHIYDNTTNVSVKDAKYIEVGGKLEDGAKIGITLQNSTGVFTSGYKSNGNNEHPSKYFFSDNGSYNIKLNDSGEAELTEEIEFSGIKAEFTPSGKVYSTDGLNSLKTYLEVKGVNNDGSDYNGGALITDYTLSGELKSGETVTITVSHQPDKSNENLIFTTTFTVAVADTGKELDDYADNQFKGSTLTDGDEEKAELEKAIEDKLAEAKDKIGTDDDRQLIEDTKKEIDDLIEEAEKAAEARKELEEKKEQVGQELEDYFDEKTEDLTEEEKQELEDKIKDVIDKAKEEIGKGEDFDQVVEDAKKDIDDIIADEPEGGADDAESNLLWLTITLSVILLLDAGVLIAQLVSRKKNGTDKAGEEDKKGAESEGGNE